MLLPSRRWLAVLYVASGVSAGAISYGFGQSKNLEVFCHAARSLLAAKDLYDGSSVDWFKYSPTFALLFVPLARLPGWLAAALWGAINFGGAFLGIDAAMRAGEVTGRGDTRSRVALLAALPGILLATDGDQANLLAVGAILAAFAAFERGHTCSGAAAVAAAALIKVFPIGAALFALLRPDRERSLFRILVALAALAALPLVVLRPSELAAEYASWGALLRADHDTRGWSLVTVARELGASGAAVQIAGIGVLAVHVVGAIVTPADARLRRALAASLLAFFVLFNHRSEYATFVVSAVAVGIWFAETAGRVPAPVRIALLVLTCLAHGPFGTVADPTLDGPLSFLAAHRVYHPIRLVPLTAVWVLLQVDVVRALMLVALRHARPEETPAE